jgi:hypothetical protein
MIYLFAIAGTFAFILARLKLWKQKKDNNGRFKESFSHFLKTEWDDWGLSLIFGLGWAAGQKWIVMGFIRYKEWDVEKAKEVYEVLQYPGAFLGGVFFGMLFMVGFETIVPYLKKKIKALTGEK